MKLATGMGGVGVILLLVVGVNVFTHFTRFDWIMGGTGMVFVVLALVAHNNPKLFGDDDTAGESIVSGGKPTGNPK